MVVICMLLTNSNTAHFLRSLLVINVSLGGGCLNVLPPFLIGLFVLLLSCKGSFSVRFFLLCFLYKFYSFSPYIQVKDPFLFMLWDKEWGSFSSISIPSFSTICWKDDPFPHWITMAPLLKIIDHISAGLFLDSAFHADGLSVYLSVHTQSQLPYIHSKPWNQV